MNGPALGIRICTHMSMRKRNCYLDVGISMHEMLRSLPLSGRQTGTTSGGNIPWGNIPGWNVPRGIFRIIFAMRKRNGYLDEGISIHEMLRSYT